MAVNELRDKAKRSFYAIKRSINTELPITTWLKIFKSIIEPIALYGSEVWGYTNSARLDKMGQTSH